MSARMEDHMKIYGDTLATELKHLEKAFGKQKSQFLKQTENSFNKGMKHIAEKAEVDLETRLELVQMQEKELDEMIINDATNITEMKVKMGESVRALEEEIGMVEALTYLNSERLDYEIHVLNKHEEENSVIKSEQKRKITSLQDLSNKLKLKLMDTEKDSEKEQIQLVDSIKDKCGVNTVFGVAFFLQACFLKCFLRINWTLLCSICCQFFCAHL